MSPTRHHGDDRAWQRDQEDERSTTRNRDNEHGTHEESSRRHQSGGSSGAYRQPFGDSTNQRDLRPSRGGWPEDRGYDDYRRQQQSGFGQEEGDKGQSYEASRRAGYRQRRHEAEVGSQTGNYEPGYGTSRGYGQQSGGQDTGWAAHGDWHDRHWQGVSPGYGRHSNAPWREDYGSTGRPDHSQMPDQGNYGSWQKQSEGSFRGQGPKGYQRSDQRIQEDVNDCLTESSILDASGIEIMVREGEVTLSGTVNSRSCKREAEDLADRISGVKHVQNNLRVKEAAKQETGFQAGSNTASFGTSSSSQTSGGTSTTGKTTRASN